MLSRMSNPKSILLVEPRVEGHHLRYLQYLSEDFLSFGLDVHLALDMRSDEARHRLDDKNPEIIKNCRLVSLYDTLGHIRGRGLIIAAKNCATEVGATEIFFNSFDEVASKACRRAALFSMPPPFLRGKISGIYFRPRQLDTGHVSFNKFLKKFGFGRLYRQRWFKHIFLANEFLVERVRKNYPGETFSFLPDPADLNINDNQVEAQKKLGVPSGRRILLHFGSGSKRKGLQLLLTAIESLPKKEKLFLIVAGKQEHDLKTRMLLSKLEQAGHLKLMDYYVSDAEEKLCFAAADFVILPYLSHYGSTNVLARAAAAQKPVVASDYHLVGRRVLTYNLGILFENAKHESLSRHLLEAIDLPKERYDGFMPGLKRYAETFSREAFRRALADAYHIH